VKEIRHFKRLFKQGITLFSETWIKNIQKVIQKESVDLPSESSLEFHPSHKSEIKEGHNAASGTFWNGSVSEITVNDYTQQFANSENDVDEYICKKSMKW